ncbi:NAD(P)H-quinone oxidoreductase chain 4 1 [bacterium BMS3Abin02]|nr:NAD(P)H-quinone oxidoreductase chain 4 1 [bacterium BMS3Abin02]GBE22153.1 NAD(P)H-quinone oxidoreductase chain 4 1 [bacterium BMS3Bbin01]HDH25539.1 NADH-quinone oxidoreductase subunit M [Actinomycetota bacterium]HDL48991.1 NADH-quinone oxidoreductase subunit M [Actinomycetota bacterium]
MLSIAIFLPVIAAAALLAFPKDRPQLARWTAVAVSLVPLGIIVAAWTMFKGGIGFQLIESAPWITSIGVTYQVGIDGLSLPLLAMSALLFTISMIFPADLRGKARQYYAAFLFLETASLGLFLALDLILFFVFFDLSLVGMYFLIGIWGHGDAQRSALKFFLYTLVGSLALLLGILGIYLNTSPRTFDMIEIIRTQPLPAAGLASTLIFWAIALGFAIKAPLVPFHTWLPPAHVDAPAPASAILAGVLLKMGTYGFIRVLLQMMPGTFDRFAFPLGVIAVVSIVYGALVAMAQTNLKRLIAYTSVNHMGYVILGVSVGAAFVGADSARSLALTGATVEMVAHGLITGSMFLLSGSILARGRTYEMGEFGGLASRAPALTGAMMLAAFASLGLPGLAGFVAEFQIFAGTLGVFPWLAAIGLLGIVLTAALFLRMLQQVFLGPLPERWTGWTDLGWSEIVALTPALVLVVVIGIAPAWLVNVVNSLSQAIVGG